MPEFVEYSSKLDIIHIKSFGIVTKEEIKQSFKEINALMEKMDNHKILVDHSEASSFPGNVEAFNFGSGIALTFKNAAIAIIHSEKNSDILNFLEKVVLARGGQLKIFENSETAIKWLKSTTA